MVSLEGLPAGARPRERLLALGAESLSDVELLALVLGSGVPGVSALEVAFRLLSSFGSLAGVARAGVPGLLQHGGVGPARAARVLAALELGRRLLRPQGRARIRGPADAARFLLPLLAGRERERSLALILNTKNEVISEVEVGEGGPDHAPMEPLVILRATLVRGGTGVLVGHNHPSGDPEPSREDVEVTRRLEMAARVVGVRFLDHLVVGDGRWVSLRERGVLGPT